jgi:energy-coupling factor transport system ATP-binding protein
MLGPLSAGFGKSAAGKRAEELVSRLHLAHLADANPFTLSGGEKRRLSVATALATAPSVLILDEPTFGQDRRTAMELLRLLAALRDEGRAVLFVTHDREFATALADRTLRLPPRQVATG